MELRCFSFQFHLLLIKIIIFKLLVVMSILKIFRGFFFPFEGKAFRVMPLFHIYMGRRESSLIVEHRV